MGNASPPEAVALPVTELSESEDASVAASADGGPGASGRAIIPAQPDPSEGEKPEDAVVPTHEEVSAELEETHVPLGRRITKDGFDEQEVHELRAETQVKYYKARRKGVPLRYGRPWPLLMNCYKFIKADFLRDKHKNRERPQDVEALPLPDPGPCAMEEVDFNGAIDSFLRRHLPDAERQVWLMTHGEGMRRKEIAERLGIDRGTVSARLARAEERLKSLPPDELDHLR
ncbi:conserved hypothetical protein [Streptomyces sviceus ATCC 29083]|uniref:RNA polymerase sigma factor 70 region 4 type 2 domain-containing protein n=2 Tax=Streptomyces TaxID=1883 RepID=B5HS65_STRX2|nr:conserved hypothetical protein [Streptomyces sviceus ATCC 29083]